MSAEGAAQRRGYAGRSELELRSKLEEFCRERWPEARVVHEIVMGEGRVRADVAAICPVHIAAFEIKGSYDDTTRILHQVGMFQLCVPEVWMVVADNHVEDAEHIHYLLPSVGLITAPDMDRGWGRNHDKPIELTVKHEAAPRAPVPELAIRMLWADELRWACSQLRHPVSEKVTRSSTTKILLGMPWPEVYPILCSALRSREALWRADPVANPPSETGAG